MNIDLLKKELIRDEGVRQFPYMDSVGKLTIGIGRNLTDRGLSRAEIDFLLENDIKLASDDLDRFLPWWVNLTENRQRVLANMCFNLGITKLLEFKKTLKAIEGGDYEIAAQEMGESKWARQVGNRAARLQDMMRNG